MALTQKDIDANKQAYEAAHKEFAEQDTQVAGLGDAIKKGASALGKAILGDGTNSDATADGRAYKLHVEESKSEGATPMTRDEFIKSRQQKV